MMRTSYVLLANLYILFAFKDFPSFRLTSSPKLFLSSKPQPITPYILPSKSSLSQEHARNSRRKVGPPQRKRDFHHEETSQSYSSPESGRVAVYCVGSAIDIVALRSYIFRRNFGNHNDLQATTNRPGLGLTRGKQHHVIFESHSIHDARFQSLSSHHFVYFSLVIHRHCRKEWGSRTSRRRGTACVECTSFYHYERKRDYVCHYRRKSMG